MGVLDVIPTGVLTGDNVLKLMQYAQDHKFAIPSVNITSTSTANAVLEAARDNKSPIMIQLSNGGTAYYAGKGIDNTNQKASIAGAIAAAHYICEIAPLYKVPVILHSDHCAKDLLPWFDGMLAADEAHFKLHGEPLFSSHMLDLSKEPKDWNIKTCVSYLKRMVPMKLWLEMEIGITGGEEDGVNNEHVEHYKLFSTNEDVWDVYRAFAPESFYCRCLWQCPWFLCSWNTRPIFNRNWGKSDKPAFLVFHGGSGSTKKEITDAVSYGVVKMNVDTDTQYAYWHGLKLYYEKNKDYLQTQVGNPEGPELPNKKHYDPRVWVRAAEKGMYQRVIEACQDLGNVNTL